MNKLSKPFTRRIGQLSLVLISALVIWHAPTAQAELPEKYRVADLKVIENAFVAVADSVRPSVVAIKTFLVNDPKNIDARFPGISISQGSGFIVSDDGYIATNRHVLEEANHFRVTLHNGLQYSATLVESDPRNDLAVLKIEAEGLSPVVWAENNNVKVGQWTVAVGNPFGLANKAGRPSVTFGTVSSLGRNMTARLAKDSSIQYYGNLIETSSTINPGSSGGPLFNIDGKMIGIVTAIETSSGVSEGAGFAIPANENIHRVISTLKKGVLPRYGFMGITLKNTVAKTVSREVIKSRIYRGTEIESITTADGPAALAGLKPRDVIIEVNGQSVEDSDHLVRLVSFSTVGSKVDITYLRHNVKRKTTVTLGDRYKMLGVALP